MHMFKQYSLCLEKWRWITYFSLSLRCPATELASAKGETKVRDTRGERRGTAEGKQTAPALTDMKPQSRAWLILPESGGGASQEWCCQTEAQLSYTLPWRPSVQILIIVVGKSYYESEIHAEKLLKDLFFNSCSRCEEEEEETYHCAVGILHLKVHPNSAAFTLWSGCVLYL